MNDSLSTVRELLANARRPVSFSGAGLSAESGISTFRSKNDEGLWSRFNPQQLASQQGFQAAPDTVIDWYNWRRKTLADAEPNAGHIALGQQSRWIHITQNVDNLLEQAGADEESVLHLHGTLLRDHCNGDCGYSDRVDLHNPLSLRDCPQCGQPMRPSVVWFGESLPQTVLRQATEAAATADVFLVVGTSAQVYPAAGLIDIARDQGARIIIVNIEADGVTDSRDTFFEGSAADTLPGLFQTD